MTLIINHQYLDVHELSSKHKQDDLKTSMTVMYDLEYILNEIEFTVFEMSAEQLLPFKKT